MKRIISVIIAFILLSVSVCALPIIEQTTEKVLIKGVNYTNIKGLYSSGWQDIHIVTADLNEEHLSLEIFKNKSGESYLENTLEAAKNNDAVVAVNGDFFASKRGEAGRGSAVGVEIRDGKLYSSASVTESMNTLYKMMDETKFDIDAFKFDITLTAANGMQDKIKLINKYDDLTGIVMYTSDWSKTSVGSLGGVIEVSVDKDGKVVEKVTESAPIHIPEGGYVLSAHMSYNTFLLDYVNVGDTVNIDISSAPDFTKIETAVGGGGVLVRNGIAQSEFSHNVSGKNPRTAIGLDKTGTKITFVVVDGRRADAKGMTQQELAKLMVDLNCYTALNFDGGGSSAMAIDDGSGKTVINQPSDGTLRKVTNSVGIVTDADEKTLSELKIVAPEHAFIGLKTHLTVKGFDKYLREVKVDKPIKISTDNGKIVNGVLIPAFKGEATVTAKSGTLSVSTTINVLENPTEIYFKEEKINLESKQSVTPVLIGKNSKGLMAEIDLADVLLTTDGNCIKINGTKIEGLSKGAAHLSAQLDVITANTQVLVDGADPIGTIKNIKIPDIKNTSSALLDGGYRFSVFGNTKNNDTLFDMFVMNKATIKMKQSSDFQFFLGGNINKETLSHVDGTCYTAKNYSCIKKNGDTFITLPNEKSQIYTNDTSVWEKFKTDVNNSTGNLFVFIDRNFISNNEVEINAFKRILEEQAKEKNVYVFGGGFVNDSTIENRVRYINTAGFFNSVTLNGTSVDYIKYVLVTVNGTEVTYEYKKAIE